MINNSPSMIINCGDDFYCKANAIQSIINNKIQVQPLRRIDRRAAQDHHVSKRPVGARQAGKCKSRCDWLPS